MAHSHHHSGMRSMGYTSALEPPNQPPATSEPHSHSGGTSLMMPMTFYFGYKKVELLFAGLLIDSASAMALAFVAVFLLAMGYEGLKRAGEWLRAQCSPVPRSDGTCPKDAPRLQLLSARHLLQAMLHVLQVTLSYLLMLTAMTYNAYLFLALLAGAGAGYWLFGGKKAEDVDSQNLCRNKVELDDIGRKDPEQGHQVPPRECPVPEVYPVQHWMRPLYVPCPEGWPLPLEGEDWTLWRESRFFETWG
ncbi:high affinity copper uptake protein 1-like [Sorex fumeus]|uniref:high affinity copper uptake protein 1-like n=1 Tax=Sorex fumeus TaxID=62283 RepID=UPI0024ACA5AF|nr:high affinity copper uptake protein 1-like [Sorex fumeus]